jgi:two-component system, OmpR family, alkaline phosphatase synthesis response regulator PhoP
MTSNPAPRPSQASSIEDANAIHDASNQVVLVVDDNLQNLELLTAYLEDLKCRVLTARDGLEAIQQVQTLPDGPDLVLLDVMMPRMSGFQVCQKLRADPRWRDIPIVMVTALNEVGDVERSVDVGADDFLTKPVNKLELLTRVRSLLRVRALKRKLERAVDEVKRLGGTNGG